MSFAKDPEANAVLNDIIFPPGDLDSDEPQLETYFHLQQLILLLTSLEWWWRDRTDFFAAGNLTIYYSPRQRKSEHFRGPDFFVVLDTEWKPRKSWVVWEEDGKYPNLIIEVLSSSTAAIDRGLKKQIFQDIFRTPYYFWIDPDTSEFQGFHLLEGQYEPIQPDGLGRMPCRQLGLLVGIHAGKLRFFTPDGQLVLTPTEAASQAEHQASQEAQRAEQEHERAERLAAKLRELGIEP